MSVAQNVRHSIRLLLKAPGFTLVAVVTLALGIGSGTTIFTVVNAVLLRPLPYRDSSRLVLVTAVDRVQQNAVGCLTYPRYTLIADQNSVFAAVAAFTPDSVNVTGPGDAEQVRAARVSPGFFGVLGVAPATGRTFVPDDGKAARGLVAIISDDLWRNRFGASPNIVGKPIAMDGASRTVIGVLPPGFTFGLLGGRADVWTPQIDELTLATPEQLRNGTCYLNAVGRLADGVDRVQAQTQMNVLNKRYAQEFAKLPDADPRRLVLAEPLQERVVGGFRPMLTTITAAVALVLLVACANVASLLLARGLARRRELAVRTALGASRGNLVGHVLSESLILAVAGGLVGLVVSLWGVRTAAVALRDVMPRSEELTAGLDPRIPAFAIALSVFTGVVAGLAPAFQISGRGLIGALRTDDRGAIGHQRRTVLRSLLVASQVGLSLVLLVGAGLLVRSFWKLQNIAPGFEPRGTLTMNLSLPTAKYSNRVQMVDFYQRLQSRVEALPGIDAISLSSALPVNPSRMTPILAEGQPQLPLAERPVVIIQTLMGPYLKTMGIPLVKGRSFDERDTSDSPSVVVVNQAFARRFFGKQDPVGKHVVLGRRTTPAEIVGVIGDVKNSALTAAPAPEIDIPFAQLPWPSMNLTIRSGGDPARTARPIRNVIASLDRDLPVKDVQTMEEVLAAGRFHQKTIAVLLGLFALCALVLALVGLYGLIAYSVGQRRQELGVRMALGARHDEVIRLVVRQGIALAAAGAVGGLAVTFAATWWMASMVYDVSTTDPITFAVGPTLLLVFAGLASWIPARRAARIDPSEALRS